MIMKRWRLLFFLPVAVLSGCDSREDFADYDNKEEVTGFRESHNKKVLGELEGKKEELAKQLDDVQWKAEEGGSTE